MAAALRPLSLPAGLARAGAALLAALAALPLLGAAGSALHAGAQLPGWQALLDDTQLSAALGLSVWTGAAATALSVGLTAWVLSHTVGTPAWAALVRALAPMLAVPHAALAIGLVFLIAPSGWVLRALSPWLTGLHDPPGWLTTQDPWGLGLIAALVAKEIPFLLWVAASQLQRADTGQRWQREMVLACTLGYSRRRAWWRVVWPQLWPRLGGPVLAVAAYSLTVVDVALVIGPATPPTAAVLVWQWLLDADPATNAQGAAGAWLLALVAAAGAGACWLLRGLGRGPWRWRRTNGRRGGADPGPLRGWLPLALLAATYLAVMAALALGSVFGVWTFPALWPASLSLAGWRAVLASASTIGTTVALAAASVATALAWAVLWLELAPRHWDARLRQLIYLPLVLPALLWVVGLHRLLLAWSLDGQWAGLWLAHTLAALPYVLIALSPSYLSVDSRLQAVSATLGRSRLVFLLRVKWPLLRAGLWSALAVGFAVSVAQYLPTLFIGAGRHATVTTEAVTLASGGQRSLLAAFAWLQWLLPAAVFAVAAWAGRPRRFRDVSR